MRGRTRPRRGRARRTARGLEHAGGRSLDIGAPGEVHGRIAGAVEYRDGVAGGGQGGGDRAADRAGAAGDDATRLMAGARL